MPATVVAIDSRTAGDSPAAARRGGEKRGASWSVLEVAQPGRKPEPFGILFIDEAENSLSLRLRDTRRGELVGFDEPSEQEADIFAALTEDLLNKGREMGGRALVESLEDSASNFFRIGERTAIRYSGQAQATVDRLFEQYVLAGEKEQEDVRPFVTHLPLYGLRAAATKFGEMMESEQEGWVRAPERLRLTEGMFVARVVGRSMEPRIPDGSLCVFRGPVVGSRQGRLVLIEKLDETDFAWRYTVKRYAAHGARDEEAERTEKIRLEPINKEFAAFELEGDQFRVIAEFVQVLPS
jgi:SOS-response transcriptional repressor LexA